MTNKDKFDSDKIKAVFAGTLGIILLILIAWVMDAPDRELLEKVQGGELTLRCHFKDGWRVVDPSKVKDFYGTTWIFTNGSASRCEVL